MPMILCHTLPYFIILLLFVYLFTTMNSEIVHGLVSAYVSSVDKGLGNIQHVIFTELYVICN